jgi:uncharacterized membrane protein YfcA
MALLISISLATLAMSAVSRLDFVHVTSVTDCIVEIGGMSAGWIIAGWLGAGFLSRIPKSKIMGFIAVLLIGTAGLLALETVISRTAWTLLAQGSTWRMPTAAVAGVLVGTISSLMGVAGGEFIIPILIFIFGADIRTAGTASVLIVHTLHPANTECPMCKGSGQVPQHGGLRQKSCPRCAGRGWIKATPGR